MTRWALALSLIALTGCAAPAAYGPGPAAPALQPAGPAPLPAPSATPLPAWPQGSVPGAPAGSVALTAPAREAAALVNPASPADANLGVGAIEDDDEGEGSVASSAPSSPMLALSDAEIDERFHRDPGSLGSASIGPASAGALVNGVQMPRGEHWQLLDPGRAWGTQETVDALVHIIERVNQRFPGAPPLAIGHLSAQRGGHLSPHRSHQSGRDADVGYYYRGGTRLFVHATADNLDLARTWALVKAALKETTVDMIFMDRAVQRVLGEYAQANGEDVAFLDEVFQYRGKNARAQVRHIKGHDNHIHFRWHNPTAEAMGRRVARFVAVPKAPPATRAGLASAAEPEPVGLSPVRARSGDTLVILARRYGTTVEEIQRVNGLNGNAIRAGVVYRIPQKAAPARAVVASRVKGPSRVAQRKPQHLKTPGARTATKPSAAAPDR